MLTAPTFVQERKIRRSAGWALLALAAAVVAVAGASRPSRRPLSLAHNGVHGVYTLHNRWRQLMLYNFRAVAPGLLYRGSGFPHNKIEIVAGRHVRRAAAFADDELFRFFKSRNIRTVVALQDVNDFYDEQGYFEYWNEAPENRGYRIETIRLSIPAGHAYDANGGRLAGNLDQDDRRFGLRAAAEFIELMKHRKPGDGAVYVHDNAGKDSVGIVCAAYELWRNRGTMDRDALWRQVLSRYLVSNVLIARDGEAAFDAGGTHACGRGEEPGFVCSAWLDRLRPQLETIAQVG